jgi:hypothetical protein
LSANISSFEKFSSAAVTEILRATKNFVKKLTDLISTARSHRVRAKRDALAMAGTSEFRCSGFHYHASFHGSVSHVRMTATEARNVIDESLRVFLSRSEPLYPDQVRAIREASSFPPRSFGSSEALVRLGDREGLAVLEQISHNKGVNERLKASAAE